MGRDSRGDRYSSTRQNNNNNNIEGAEGGAPPSSTRYGRYTNNNNNNNSSTTHRSKSPRSSRRKSNERHRRRRHSSSDDEDNNNNKSKHKSKSSNNKSSRHRRTGGDSKESGRRGHRRTHTRSSSSSSASSSASTKNDKRPKFEELSAQDLLLSAAPPPPPTTTTTMINNELTESSPSVEFMNTLLQQQLQMQQFGNRFGNYMMPLPNTPGMDFIAPPQVDINNTTNINNIEHKPEQQQQEEEQQQNNDQENKEQKQNEQEEDKEKKEGSVNEDAAIPQTHPTRVLPSVADFVPVIPKSLIGILGGPASTNHNNNNNNNNSGAKTNTISSTGLEGENGKGDEEEKENNNQEGEGGVLTTISQGALTVLQAPKLSPEAERRAREARRAHITGFPQCTTRLDLLQYFTMIIPEVRRVKVQREINQLTEQLRLENNNNGVGEDELEKREIPSNAIIDIDRVIDLAVNSAKSKPFAFLEVNLADLITEIVEESVKNPDMFTFLAPDGQSYPITIRRPRDYQALPGCDYRKIVMLGFPSTIDADKLRVVFEQFGSILSFDVKSGIAYAEFENEQDAKDCVRDLHGETLGNNVMVMMPLYDWLKVVCTHANIDVSLDPDDPVSGASLLAKDKQIDGSLVPVLADDIAKKEEPVDHMKELLEHAVALPEVVLHFSKTFPHLNTLYGSTVPIFPTRILVLLNLFDEEELVLDETYEQLLTDISEEVEKYGRVKSLIVPRRSPPPIPPKAPKNYFESRLKPNKKKFNDNNSTGHNQRYNNKNKNDTSNGDNIPNTTTPENIPHNEELNNNNNNNEEEEESEEVKYERAKAEYLKLREAYTEKLMHPIHGGFGRVFVEYETIDEAAAAQSAIAGRLFGARTVVTSFMFEDVLYPPTAEEEQAEAEEKIKLYLEGVGAAEENEEENNKNNKLQQEVKKGEEDKEIQNNEEAKILDNKENDGIEDLD